MSDIHLHCDFESRSVLDLKEVGLDNYVDDETTEPTMMGYAFGDDEVRLWLLGEPLPWAIAEHVYAGGLVYAHNASFEIQVWNRICAPRYGWPKLSLDQMRCTMALCYAQGLPGKLEEAAPALGITERKDAEGHRVMMQLARPRHIYAPGEPMKRRVKDAVSRYLALPDGRVAEYWDNPEKWEKCRAYCRQDVVVERELTKRLMPLSAKEQQLWVLDATINARGVRVDVPAIKGALVVVEAEKARLNAEMERVTGGMVSSTTNVNVLTDFVRFMGVETEGVAKADVNLLLEDPKLPASVRAALLLRQEAGKASLAKLDKMLSLKGSGDRIRFGYAYHGANTGRWAARGAQFQNAPRVSKAFKDPKLQDKILRLLAEGNDVSGYLAMMYGPPMDVLVNCLRGFIIPSDGHHFVGVDFSSIEGRVLAWLAGEEWKLEAFRAADAGTGPGIYQLSYARSFGVDVETVDEDQRQIGKVLELACGFGGGVGAFQAMSKIYNVKVSDKVADGFKTAWRAAHPATKKYWYDLENAAITAVLNPGRQFSAGARGREVVYKVAGSFLWAKLPSGRVISYPYPKVMQVTTPWGEMKDALTYMTVPGDRPQDKARILPDPNNRSRWARVHAPPSIYSENNTQAVARDLLAEALVRVEARGWPVVHHAHDETVAEVPANSPPELLQAVVDEIIHVPEWAAKLPIAAKGGRGARYGKD